MQLVWEAEMMVRAQAQNLIQGLNTPISTMFPNVEGVSYHKSQKIVSLS